MNPVHISTLYFIKVHYIIILSSTPGSLKRFLNFRFFYYNVSCPSRISYSFVCPSHLVLLDFIIRPIQKVVLLVTITI
jgi:hypothetical protein